MHWYTIVVIFVGTLLNSIITYTEKKELAFCLQSLFNAVTLYLIIRFLENAL